MEICSRCIYDERVPNIKFNEDGVCNYCLQIDELDSIYHPGKPKGLEQLEGILTEIKAAGKGKKYDCIVGVSGGIDSSYLLLKCVEWGLRPLAVHYDNTWNTSISTENIRKLTSKLNIDLVTYVVDNKEADEVFRSFFLAGVPEFDASTDMSIIQVLRKYAAKNRVKYLLSGHSYQAEGISPQGNNYFDAKYVKDIFKRFGKGKIKTLPLMTFWQMMKWTIVYRQKQIRPLWYIDYSKQVAREKLEAETEWKYYGGHHLENGASSFAHMVYIPQRFGIDHRNWSIGAEVRSGVTDREEGLRKYNEPIKVDPKIINYAKKRMRLSDEEYEYNMTKAKNRSHKDFKTYKKRFERLRPLFYILLKSNLVTHSFYMKYCFPRE